MLSSDNKLKKAFKITLPIVFGYLPTGFIFGFMLIKAGYNFFIAPLMSLIIYAGAGQYLAVRFFIENTSLLNIALLIFLINSKHLFYGLSLLEPFKKLGKFKLYCIFGLTDETYALLTTKRDDVDITDPLFIILVTIIDHISWITGTLLGALCGFLLKQVNIMGLDFAMTALFIVIIIEQLKSYKTKLPFIIGGASSLVACFIFADNQILLFGTIISIVMLILFRTKIELSDRSEK